MPITFLFKAKNGKPDFGSEFNEARLRQHLKENEGKVYRIEQEKSTRTLSQNKLYHKFLNIIEIETGQPAEDVHEWAKRKFLEPRVIKINGEEMRIPGTTTTLNKTAFSDYMDKIAAEVGVAIPDTEAYLAEMELAPTI
jgi:hypothetical protein